LEEKQKQTKMSKTKSSSGIGFTGMLTILFIGLKLTNVIDWSWWWVLSPPLIGLVLGVTLIAIGVLIEKKLK
jgi:hypothetical protein